MAVAVATRKSPFFVHPWPIAVQVQIDLPTRHIDGPPNDRSYPRCRLEMGIGPRIRGPIAPTFYLVTAVSALTWPLPLNALYPVPPRQTCGFPFDTEGKKA